MVKHVHKLVNNDIGDIKLRSQPFSACKITFQIQQRLQHLHCYPHMDHAGLTVEVCYSFSSLECSLLVGCRRYVVERGRKTLCGLVAPSHVFPENHPC